jgi:hypothetical protein
MLKIEREGEKINLTVDTNIGYSYTPSINCGSVPYAILLTQHLQDKMGKELTRIRQEAYNQGWDDKTKRKPKQNWFRGIWK